jgi:phosphoinositide-3-kinase, regulatory subunit 4
MDIFSAGCVIAEIFMNGTPLFDLSKLFQYRDRKFEPSSELGKFFIDQKITNLILKMVDKDPNKRPTPIDCFKAWNQYIFPKTFSKLLYHLGASF